MIRMTGFCAGAPIRPDRMLEDRRMGVSTVIRPVTFQQIVPKLSQLETAKRSSPKSNYVCTGDRHRAQSSRSRGCRNCQRKHHTSICDQTNNARVGRFLTAQDKGTSNVIFLYILLLWSRLINGIKCRALLDTGAGSSYASSAILDHLRIRPLREENSSA